MPRPDERTPEEDDSSKVEEETRRLMERVLETGVSTISSSEPEVTTRSTSTARMLEESFQRIRVRMEDLLSMIDDSLKSTEPNVEQQVSEAIANIAKKLKSAGLGVFYTQTIVTVRNELSSSLAPSDLLGPIHDALTEAHDQVEDIITKASRGTIKNVARSTGSLQAKVIQLYASLQDRERQIEVARVELFRLRKQIAELEATLSHRDEEVSTIRGEMSLLQESMKALEAQLEERNQVISELKSQLTQAQSQIEQQKAMIEKLGSAEEIVADYEDKLMRLSQLEGELARLRTDLEQRDETIKYLREETAKSSEYASALEIKATELNEQLAKSEGEIRSLRTENESLQAQIAELTARWNTLYQVAEDEPAFKAYFLVADKTRGVPLSHLSAAMGIPVRRLKEDLEKFIEVGLVEIDGGIVRPRALSDVARDLQGQEDQMIEEVKAELGDDSEIVLEAFDLSEPLFDEGSSSEENDRK
ncbi:MAG: hypothetical protein ACTSYL_02870 [Candidatus Thorarchaeota archaeon]